MTEVVSARRAATRDRLADAAVGIFAERGVLGASVEELCKAAGFTRGAFYSNFTNRNELCLYILNRRLTGHLDNARGALLTLAAEIPEDQAQLDALTRLGASLFLSAQPQDRATVLATSELRLHAVRDPEFRVGYMAIINQLGAFFIEIMEQAGEFFGLHLNVRPDQVITILEGVYEMSALIDLLNGEEVQSTSRIEMIAEVLKGLFTEA